MDQKKQIADRLKEANNILVTVSANPSVDQLASCIGLTLAINKMGKHATAVFSGAVPSTIEFLQPEKTLEKDTNSLRDFIISLDKSKADKLRYKVEDKVVKIFITPYRTSITDKDLDFSQGDFNVDVVIALGVHNQTDLDQAITSHGRILHDATVATINVQPGGEIGSMNWLAISASSLCELAYELVEVIDKKLVDTQIATALLTGIVAETHRFSNEKTSPNTMSVSAELMAAGANQQLVATKLDELARPVQTATAGVASTDQNDQSAAEPPKAEDGTLEITHADKSDQSKPEAEEKKEPEEPPTTNIDDLSDKNQESEEAEDERTPQIHIDDQGALKNIAEMPSDDGPEKSTTDPTQHMGGSRMILQPPTLGGQLSASAMPDDDFRSSDPLSLPSPDEQSAAPSPFSPPASAATAASAMPFMPPSMTPPGSASSFDSAQPASDQAPAASKEPSEPPATTVPAPAPFSEPSTPPEPPAPVIPDASLPAPPPTPASPANQTLSQIEQDVHSPHAQTPADDPALQSAAPAGLDAALQSIATPAPLPEPPVAPPQDVPAVEPPAEPAPPVVAASDELANAREAVMNAIAAHPTGMTATEPIMALNAQPLGDRLHEQVQAFQPHPNDTRQPELAIVQPTATDPSLPGAAPPPPVPPPMVPPIQGQ